MIVVPREAFEELRSGKVKEANSNLKPLNFKQFTQDVDIVSKVMPYMQNIAVDFVGSGSSRVAFCVPKGSCDEAKDRSVCFKVALKEAGIAQNKAERGIIKKYGEKEACFPEIFAYDEKRNICLETEIGTSPKEYDMKKYFADWNTGMQKKIIKTGFMDYLKKIVDKDYVSYKKNIATMLEVNTIKNIFDVLSIVKDFKHLKMKSRQELAELYMETINETAEMFPKYKGLSSLANVLFKKGADAEMLIGDFQYPGNYALVDRGETEPTLIPIDYGLTEGVYASYYKTGAGKGLK